MKKLELGLVAIVLSLMMVSMVSAYPEYYPIESIDVNLPAAFDNGSLTEQTTVGMYDDIDPYDLSLDTALMYQIDRWRLYTTASGYGLTDVDEDEEYIIGSSFTGDEYDGKSKTAAGDYGQTSGDDDTFLIGTSGKLGPGALTAFYEKSTYEYTMKNGHASFDVLEFLTPGSHDSDDFEGLDDLESVWAMEEYAIDSITLDALNVSIEAMEVDNFEQRRDVDNYYAGYGMDFGIFSLGLGIGLKNADYDGNGDWRALEGIDGRIEDSLNSATITYSDPTATGEIRNDDVFVYDKEKDEMQIKLGTHVRANDKISLRAYVGYMEEESDMHMQRSRIHQFIKSEDFTPEYYDFGFPLDEAYTVHDEGVVEAWEKYDMDGYGLELKPTYKINDTVTVRCDLSYSSLQGDGDLGKHVGLKAINFPVDGATSVDYYNTTVDYTKDDTQDMDIEETNYGISPRVYFNYGAAKFSLGIKHAVSKRETEWTGNQTMSRWTERMYDGDGTLLGWTEITQEDGGTVPFNHPRDSQSGTMEVETTMSEFPVAVMVALTDKWTFRAGASYTVVETKSKEKSKYSNDGDDNYVATEYDADGQVVGTTTSTPDYIGTEKDTITVSESSTIDFTTYRLGLGYQMNEHVNLDLMFTGHTGDIQTDTVYASITLAF